MVVFLLLAAVAILGTAGAMSFRNAVHCVLSLAIGLVGIAGVYLELGAQFVGFTQVMVYVGAVAILAVFAIMTTQQRDESQAWTKRVASTSSAVMGVLVALGVFAVIVWTVVRGGLPAVTETSVPHASVAEIGSALIRSFALPLEIVGLLLTAAMVGAVIVAMPEKDGRR